MTALLTQCPHCQTSFRVSTAQMNAAHGLVRCGSCLGVFSASANEIRIRAPDGYVVEELPPEDEDDDANQALGDDARDEAPSLADDDDAESLIPVTTAADRIDSEPGAIADTKPAAPADLQPVVEVSLPTAASQVDRATGPVLPPDVVAPHPAADDARPLPDDNELWHDEHDPVISLGDLQLDELLDEYGEDAIDTAEPVHSTAVGVDEIRHQDDASDQISAEDGRNDDATAAAATVVDHEPLQTTPVIERTAATATAVAATNDKRQLHATLSALADDELDPLGDDQLDGLEDLPVTITRADRFGSRLAQAGLLLLNILLLLALPLPWLYAERDALATHPRFAFLAPAACRLFTCTPPPATFANAIYSQQLLVRSHPRYADALEVSFIFHNDTTLPQPFPRVELAFSSLTSQLLANRLFTPQEYLPAELRQLDAMPAKSSVQVVLELEDPGKEAVNYIVKLHPPAQ